MKLKNEIFYASRSLIRDNRFGRRKMDRLRRNEKLSPDELHELQNRYLQRTMQAAIRELPFYKHITLRFGANDARRVLAEEFPVIDKQSLLANGTTLYPRAGQRRPWDPIGKTSGTTGTPLVVYRSLNSVLLEQAFIKRQWAWAGCSDRAPRVTLRGDLVVPISQQHPPFWFWNRYERQLLVSSRHLQNDYADAIIDQIRRVEPRALQAYPSTAYTLARLLQKRGQRLNIPYLFSASEPLYEHQRTVITDWLGSTVMDMYGMAERVAFATDCEHGNMHINPDYSFVEILDDQGRPTEGEGFVVGTTFHNHVMPLLRYRLSDRTRWRPGQCPCGRRFPMIEPVTGKFEDVITGANHQPVSPSVLTFAFKGVHNIEKSQVAQVAEDRWEVRVVPAPQYSSSDGSKLIANIHRLVDSSISVDVVLKEDISSTAAGKFRWVVNETSNRGDD